MKKLVSRRTLLAALPALYVCAGDIGFAGATETDPLHPAREGSVLDRLCPEIEPVLDLRNQHTGEGLAIQFFRGSSYDIDATSRLDWFFRDWREGAARTINPRLYWALAVLRQAAIAGGAEGRTVILSGYRTRNTNDILPNAARNSLHLIGCAVDFWIPGVPVSDLRRYVEWLEVGGTGYYPSNGFVHMDTGRQRQW